MKVQYKNYAKADYNISVNGHSYLFLKSQKGILEILDKSDLEWFKNDKKFLVGKVEKKVKEPKKK